MNERLTKRDEYYGVVENHDNDTLKWKNGNRACMTKLADYEEAATLEQVQEWAKADREGRLLLLPCKVGDTIYRVCKEKNEIWEWQILYVGIHADGIVFVDDSDNDFTADDIGKTVFTTREAAEKALGETKCQIQ